MDIGNECDVGRTRKSNKNEGTEEGEREKGKPAKGV